jgi:hypothetical protein
MSALIDKLKDSTLGLQGNTPEPLNLTESKIEKEVFDNSVLDKITNTKFLDTAGKSKIESEVFDNSVLDLNGKTPITYKNTAPEGRTF